MKHCDVAHSKSYAVPRHAAFDLGRYRSIVGIPGRVRYLCEDCARGRISPKFADRFRIAPAPDDEPDPNAYGILGDY
jgi:hypothetical protein